MKYYLFLLLIFATPRLAATGEQEVLIGEVAAKTVGHGVEVKLSNTIEGKAIISIIQRGNKIEIPATVLERIEEVVPESLKILTHRPNGEAIPDDWLDKGEFIVSFDYGERKVHGTEKEIFEVHTHGRLHIRNLKVAYFEWMIPEGDNKNRWRLYQDNMPDDEKKPHIEERILAPRK